MVRHKGLKSLAVVASLSMVAAACGSDDDSSTTDDTTPAETDGEATDDSTPAETDGEATDGEATDGEATDADPAAAAGGEVSYGIVEPTWIDSYNVQDSEGFEVARLLYDGLTDYGDDLSAVPAVAESWDSQRGQHRLDLHAP